MGNSELSAERSQHIFKTPTSSYEFGANFIDPKVYTFCLFVVFYYSVCHQQVVINIYQLVNQLMLDGRLMMDGTVIARFNSVLKENFTIKTTAQVQQVSYCVVLLL